jgi:hypothetical protein
LLSRIGDGEAHDAGNIGILASRATMAAPILAATPTDNQCENLFISGLREFWPMALLKGSGLE